MNYPYSDNYLKSEAAHNERNLIVSKIAQMGERSGRIEEKLDNWLGNFTSFEEKKLAIKVFLNIDYFSQEKIENLLNRYKTKISQYLFDRNLSWESVRLIVPDENADSTHYHSYVLRKIWNISQKAIVRKSDIEKDNLENKYIIFFNDTHGSGKQFLNEFTTIIQSVNIENCLIVCITITSSALNNFKIKFQGINVIPEISTPTLFEKTLFTLNELKLLETLGNKVYQKHPMGFGKCGLLVAYHFQCPNNNLPIVWANGVNNSYKDTEKNNKEAGYPWIPLFEYIPKVSDSQQPNRSKRPISDLKEDVRLAKIDSIGKNRRRALKKLLIELEAIKPRGFGEQLLLIQVLRQIYKNAINRKEYFEALEQMQAKIDGLINLSVSEKELNFSFEIMAEFSVDFSQHAGGFANLNAMVSHLNRAIKHLGRQIYIGNTQEVDPRIKAHMLCLRSKCRRALASLYKRRGFKNKQNEKRINLLRNDALNDAEKAFQTARTHVSELEYALCLFAKSGTTTSDFARQGFSLLESIGKEGSNLIALYELVRQRRMRYQHMDAAELFSKIAQRDTDILRVYENVTLLAAAVIGMYFDREDFNNYKEYALLASELLNDIIDAERYNARQVVDLCYINAILGDPVKDAIKPLSKFKADSTSAWNELVLKAYKASKNMDRLSEALLLGLEDPVIWSRIGTFYKEFTEDYQKALEFYDRALTIRKNLPTIHLSKAQLYAYKLNDFEKAKISLSHVHSLKKHMFAWYKSKEKAGIFSELEQYIESNTS